MDISLVNKNGKYKLKVSGEITYDTNNISTVEEMFMVDIASYFTDTIRELVDKMKPQIGVTNDYWDRDSPTV